MIGLLGLSLNKSKEFRHDFQHFVDNWLIFALVLMLYSLSLKNNFNG